jgi:hypothetical protein
VRTGPAGDLGRALVAETRAALKEQLMQALTR